VNQPSVAQIQQINAAAFQLDEALPHEFGGRARSRDDRAGKAHIYDYTLGLAPQQVLRLAPFENGFLVMNLHQASRFDMRVRMQSGPLVCGILSLALHDRIERVLPGLLGLLQALGSGVWPVLLQDRLILLGPCILGLVPSRREACPGPSSALAL